jgi:hypothetical protein
MHPWLSALLALLLLLPRPGATGDFAWLCRGDQEVHSAPCCEHGDEGDRCCTRISASDDEVQAGAPAPPPVWPVALPFFARRAPRPLPAAARRPPRGPARRRFGPPALGPPAWLETHALLL